MDADEFLAEEEHLSGVADERAVRVLHQAIFIETLPDELGVIVLNEPSAEIFEVGIQSDVEVMGVPESLDVVGVFYVDHIFIVRFEEVKVVLHTFTVNVLVLRQTHQGTYFIHEVLLSSRFEIRGQNLLRHFTIGKIIVIGVSGSEVLKVAIWNCQVRTGIGQDQVHRKGKAE